MARNRDVVKSCDRDVLWNHDPSPCQGMHHAERRLVVGADDRARQITVLVEQCVDDPRAASRAVVAVPFGPGLGLGAVGRSLRLESFESSPVVGAVGAPREVGDGAVSVVGDQVMNERAHARLVVAPNIHEPTGRRACERDDWDGAGDAVQTGRGKHPVVEDQAVGLTRDRGDPRRHVFVVVPDRADQDVKATALRGDVDTAIDDVDEEQAFVLVFKESFVTAAKDHADDLLEAVRQSARRAVADEAELGDRLHHSLAGRGAGGPLAVQDPRDRRDRHAGAARHVVDRQGALLPFRVGHETLCAPTDGRLALLVSAYR